jgi:hypothetical protein
MTLLQSILATVQELKPKSDFSVSSIFVTEKIVVLESPKDSIQAKILGGLLICELKLRYPDITTQLYPPDNDGTCLAISY